eukprot:TRINITY_DN62262_c0_g1_i1.p1 TRINITY_DN62262_c0_g1~~TRINITY_DN62262_c0_g1_i1.p1  ORF type:complete len:567 (-),score=51.05 TRINITY_DN62262_c0_g1_i1:61-1695(-)
MECPVCFVPFTDQGDHVPKVFPCGHTTCLTCVQQLSQRNAASVVCPLCRLQAPSGDIRTNFALTQIIEAGGRVQQAPGQQAMSTQAFDIPSASAPSRVEPWEVGPENVYQQIDLQRQGEMTEHFAVPAGCQPCENVAAWIQQRREILRDWGMKRERTMHRLPHCLMDQMVSGSGLYPIRYLEDTWLTPTELEMVHRLERVLQDTGLSHALARDMLTPIIYDIEVALVLDNSGSMSLDMFGQRVTGHFMEGMGMNRADLLQSALQASLPGGWWMRYVSGIPPARPAENPMSPCHRRWYYARHHMRLWGSVFAIMGLDPWVYLLNPVNGQHKYRSSQIDEVVFSRGPNGTTPMSRTIRTVLREHSQTNRSQPLLLVALTDGEADDMIDFNRVLDEIQNCAHGDVQVCLMGLSLVKEDIEWFENEECDETRVRTVEAFEVENRQIQLREVVKREGGYNFMMHVMRVLVTNFYPADYDYEAPLQNLRHRAYITLHGRDRWWDWQNPLWRCCCSSILCPGCFLATACHCCGWLQGNDCGKIQWPDVFAD